MRLALLFLFVATGACAQTAAVIQPSRSSPWFEAENINFAALVPPPPAPGSKADLIDRNAVLSAQRTRTSVEIQQAIADDKEEDIFIFANVLGPGFNATELPLAARFSQHLRESSAVVNPPLKLRFDRKRPFAASALVHPVCPQTLPASFPSGHAMVGTLEALALTQIVPERSEAILARLDNYIHNRVVCGVHYPSDVAASRTVASALFGLIAASPVFQAELATAAQEVRARLQLPSLAPPALRLANFLANNTVLLIRHAEKPAEVSGLPDLTETGRHRAEAYASYFLPFRQGGLDLRISALFAGADSTGSIRPRLTLEPLSKASGLPLDVSISTKDPAALVTKLRTDPHGTVPLICWRHGQIPALLTALGASPSTLLPNGKWPDDTYDWVIVLRFDAAGHIASQQLLHEDLKMN